MFCSENTRTCLRLVTTEPLSLGCSGNVFVTLAEKEVWMRIQIK